MDNDRKTRLKKAEKVQLYKERQHASVDIAPPSHRASQTVKSLLGQCPPYNLTSSWICDSFEKKVYMVGGRDPSDEGDLPTSDIYCLNIESMKWTNLTDSFKYRDTECPFSSKNCQRECRRIPELTLPGHTLFRLHGASFLLLFGGSDDDAVASSKLIVIDLRHLEWWFQPVAGGVASGRIDPTMLVIDRKLYIFGGYREFEGDGNPHGSYSIASLSDDGRTWSWELCDVPYPQNVPQGTILSRATAIYDGKKILLTSWRTTNDNPINLTKNDLFSFHISRQIFQRVDVDDGKEGEDFPKNIDWYYSFSMPPVRITGSAAQEASNPGPSRSAPHLSRSSVSPPSVIICGWVCMGNKKSLPEIWHLKLTPDEHITKLNITPTVDKLDSHLGSKGADMDAAVMVGERLFVLGSRGDAQARNEVYNVYYEVGLLPLLCARANS